MARKGVTRHGPEQIVRKLRDGDSMLNAGNPIGFGARTADDRFAIWDHVGNLVLAFLCSFVNRCQKVSLLESDAPARRSPQNTAVAAGRGPRQDDCKESQFGRSEFSAQSRECQRPASAFGPSEFS